MTWLWIGLALLIMLAALFFWSACFIGAQADARMDKAFEEMMKRRSQNAGGALHEEGMNDADES